MKKYFLILLTSFLLSGANIESTQVYLCMGPQSERYHFNPNCHGLNRCSTPLKKVSLQEAKEEYGRTICGHED